MMLGRLSRAQSVDMCRFCRPGTCPGPAHLFAHISFCLIRCHPVPLSWGRGRCSPFPASGSWWVKGLPIMGSWHFLFLAHLSISCLLFFLPSRNMYRSLICCWLCFPFFSLLQFYSFYTFILVGSWEGLGETERSMLVLSLKPEGPSSLFFIE